MRHPFGLMLVLAVALSPLPILAQRHGGGGRVGGGGFSRGGGGGVHIGGGGGGGGRVGGGGSRGYSYGFGSGRASYGYRRGGAAVGFGYGPSWYRYPGARNPYIVRSYRPYAYYPYFYSSFGVSPYYYNDWNYTDPSAGSYYPAPTYSSVYVPPAPTYAEPVPPPVGYRAESGGRDEFGQRREPSGEPVTYLIAFRGNTVESCVAYWVEGRTLHYVTRDHAMREAPLETLDREYSEKINRERHVAFRLPN